MRRLLVAAADRRGRPRGRRPGRGAVARAPSTRPPAEACRAGGGAGRWRRGRLVAFGPAARPPAPAPLAVPGATPFGALAVRARGRWRSPPAPTAWRCSCAGAAHASGRPGHGDRLALRGGGRRRGGAAPGGSGGAARACAPSSPWSRRRTGWSGWPATGAAADLVIARDRVRRRARDWSAHERVRNRRRGADHRGGAPGADRRDRDAGLRRLRGPRAAGDRHPEGGRLLHRRPRRGRR